MTRDEKNERLIRTEKEGFKLLRIFSEMVQSINECLERILEHGVSSLSVISSLNLIILTLLRDSQVLIELNRSASLTGAEK